LNFKKLPTTSLLSFILKESNVLVVAFHDRNLFLPGLGGIIKSDTTRVPPLYSQHPSLYPLSGSCVSLGKMIVNYPFSSVYNCQDYGNCGEGSFQEFDE